MWTYKPLLTGNTKKTKKQKKNNKKKTMHGYKTKCY